MDSLVAAQENGTQLTDTEMAKIRSERRTALVAELESLEGKIPPAEAEDSPQQHKRHPSTSTGQRDSPSGGKAPGEPAAVTPTHTPVWSRSHSAGVASVPVESKVTAKALSFAEIQREQVQHTQSLPQTHAQRATPNAAVPPSSPVVLRTVSLETFLTSSSRASIVAVPKQTAASGTSTTPKRAPWSPPTSPLIGPAASPSVSMTAPAAAGADAKSAIDSPLRPLSLVEIQDQQARENRIAAMKQRQQHKGPAQASRPHTGSPHTHSGSGNSSPLASSPRSHPSAVPHQHASPPRTPVVGSPALGSNVVTATATTTTATMSFSASFQPLARTDSPTLAPSKPPAGVVPLQLAAFMPQQPQQPQQQPIKLSTRTWDPIPGVKRANSAGVLGGSATADTTSGSASAAPGSALSLLQIQRQLERETGLDRGGKADSLPTRYAWGVAAERDRGAIQPLTSIQSMQFIDEEMKAEEMKRKAKEEVERQREAQLAAEARAKQQQQQRKRTRVRKPKHKPESKPDSAAAGQSASAQPGASAQQSESEKKERTKERKRRPRRPVTHNPSAPTPAAASASLPVDSSAAPATISASVNQDATAAESPARRGRGGRQRGANGHSNRGQSKRGSGARARGGRGRSRAAEGNAGADLATASVASAAAATSGAEVKAV